MAKLNKMSVENIIREIGINIYHNQLSGLLKDATTLNQLNKDLKDRRLTADEMIQFLIDNNDNIDKEKLVYIIAQNTKEDMLKMNNKELEEMEKFQYNRYRGCYEVCLKLLQNAQVEFPVFQVKDGIVSIKKFSTMEDLDKNLGKQQKKTPNNRRQENLKRLNQIDEQIPLECLFMIGSLRDLERFVCYYEGNGPVFTNMAINNTSILLVKFVTEEEKKGRTVEEGSEEFENKKYMLLLEQSKKVLLDHPEKFDIDKFLLISAYRAKDLLERNDEMYEAERENNIKIMQVAHELIENPKLKISGSIKTLYCNKYKKITYSTEMLAKDVQKIVNGKYYSKAEISNEKRKILEGEIDLGKVGSREYLDVLDFSKNEKRELIAKNPKNLEYLSIFGQLEQEQIQESLKKIEGFKFDFIFIDSLYRNGNINKRDLVTMYMKNNMDLSRIIDINENYDLQPEITVEELMEYYEAMKENEEKTRDFDRYSLLFRELKIKGKAQEVRDEIAEQMAMKVCESDNEYEDFKNLYEANLLPIKTLIEWNDEDIIYDLIKNSSLKPRDAKDLLMEGMLDLKKVYFVLKNSDLSDAEKMNFIFSSFDGVGKTTEEINIQNEARMYLIQAINIQKEFSGFEECEIKEQTRTRGEGGIKRNQYVTDPVHRWQLFSQIDDDCVSQAYSDGTVAFTLPNVKNGTVVIEKLFKRTKNGVKINYGAATYVMSQEEFLKRKSNIEFDNKINRKVLIEMNAEGEAEKFIHSVGWGKEIKKNLGILVENGYSQEKIEEINKTVERIEKARELVD